MWEGFHTPTLRTRMTTLIENLDRDPRVDVPEHEFRRLLGYPAGHQPGERATELAHQTRAWFAAHGRPWVYLREASLDLSDQRLLIDGVTFDSPRLHAHLLKAGAQRVMLAAVSAGHAIVDRSAALWKDSKPDEYFFAEVYGSAVVEALVAGLSGRICDIAEPAGLMAIPHYSPGYAGWDVAEQNRLFDVVTKNLGTGFPEPVEVLSSGMIKPKKSLLGIFGLIPRTAEALATPGLIPCEPCQYRRAAYIHSPVAIEEPRPLNPNAQYTISRKALGKWVDQRVTLAPQSDGKIQARFRFDGSTCSNMGQPLAFDYEVTLAPAAEHHRILDTRCAPAPGDTGHTHQCAYLSNPQRTLASIAEPPALLGHPLDDILTWQRETRQSGCYCDASSRAHKWGLALETIHYALVQKT